MAGATATSVGCADRPRNCPDVRRHRYGAQTAAYPPQVDLFSAGGICASAARLPSWQRALRADRVVSPASYRLMTTVTPQSRAAGLPYGMGLAVSTTPVDAIWHNGLVSRPSGGYSAWLAYLPRAHVGIAVLCNSDTVHGSRVSTIVKSIYPLIPKASAK